MTDFAQVSVTPDQLTIVPAGQARSSIFIQNSSTVVDVFTIEVQGLDESWVELSVNSVSLFPGDSATSDLTLSVPKTSGAKAGTYPLTIKVSSRKDPSISMDVECALEVEPYYDVSAELNPQQLTGAGGQFTASLTNSGNTEMEIGLNGTDPQAALHFTYSRQTPRLAPGETQEATITVTARQQPLRGFPKTYPFQIRATGPLNTARPLELHGSLTVPPRLPRWAFPAAIACVVGLIAIIALAITYGGRRDDAPVASPILITAGSPLAGAMDLSSGQLRSFEVLVEEPGLLILQVQWDVTGNGLRVKFAASESDQAFIQTLRAAGLLTTFVDEELLIPSGEYSIPLGQAYVSKALSVSFQNKTSSDTSSTFSLSFQPASAVTPEATATAIPVLLPSATSTPSPIDSPTPSPTASATATATVTPTPAPRRTLKIEPVLPTAGKIVVSPQANRDGTYEDGTSITVSAQPARGCSFGGWSGSMTTPDEKLNFVIDSNVALKATFWCLIPIVTPTPTPGLIIFPTFTLPPLKLLP